MSAVHVSVVVASHRPDYIEETLRTVRNSSAASGLDVQIIIVADYDTTRFQDRGVDWYFHDDRSISAKRNIGVEKAEAPVVAFVDDDCRVDENWISTGYRYLRENPLVAAVEGKTTVDIPPDAPGMIREYKRLEKPGYRTNNIFYRKDVFDSVGGFDTRFTVQREDLDLAFTLLSRGESIAYCEEIKVIHRFRKNEWWDLLKNGVNRRFDPLLFSKHPEMYRENVRTPIPRGIFVLLIFHFMVAFNSGTVLFFPVLFVDVLFSVLLGLRRSGAGLAGMKRFFPELLCVVTAPLVFFFSLLYGSIKFRKLLII
ncbi:MAG: glycosyltransferase family 2 protein [Chitinispirillaceae bacterium]